MSSATILHGVLTVFFKITLLAKEHDDMAIKRPFSRRPIQFDIYNRNKVLKYILKLLLKD